MACLTETAYQDELNDTVGNFPKSFSFEKDLSSQGRRPRLESRMSICLPSKGFLNGPGDNNCFLNAAIQVCFFILISGTIFFISQFIGKFWLHSWQLRTYWTIVWRFWFKFSSYRCIRHCRFCDLKSKVDIIIHNIKKSISRVLTYPLE